MTTPLAAKIAREYGTPCAVIDMDRVERNIARIQVACDKREAFAQGSEATKQSIHPPVVPHDGLLRFARNDESTTGVH